MIFLARAYTGRNGPRTREELLAIVRANQGIMKTELMRQAGLAWGTIHYHLRVLVSENQLVFRRKFGWIRIYTPDATEELQLMPLMRRSLVTQLVELVRQSPSIGIQELSKATQVSRKIVRRHLNDLVEHGVLERTATYRPQFRVKTGEMMSPQQSPVLRIGE